MGGKKKSIPRSILLVYSGTATGKKITTGQQNYSPHYPRNTSFTVLSVYKITSFILTLNGTQNAILQA